MNRDDRQPGDTIDAMPAGERVDQVLWYRQFRHSPWMPLARGTLAECEADQQRRRNYGYRGTCLILPAGERPAEAVKIKSSTSSNQSRAFS